MPDTTTSGRRGRTRPPECSATYTQSAGVPSIDRIPPPWSRRRSGRLRVREWLWALCSVSGAHTTTSATSRSASPRRRSPSARYPSSLERRTSGFIRAHPRPGGRDKLPALVGSAVGYDRAVIELEEHLVEALGKSGVAGAISVAGVSAILTGNGPTITLDVTHLLTQWPLLTGEQRKRRAAELARRFASDRRTLSGTSRSG